MSTQISQLEDDDPIDTTSDYTEEYERYLSNLENSYDICLSIDFIQERLILAQKSIHHNFEPIADDILDSAHTDYLLSTILPKSVEYLCKTDLNNLYDQDIIQYQKTHCQTYTTRSDECREFLVNKIESYFEFIIQMILALKPHSQKEFYDVLKDIFMLTHRLYKVHTGWIDRLSQEYRQQIMEECSGKYADCNSLALKQWHPNYVKLINFFGSKNGFTVILTEMLDGRIKKKRSQSQSSANSDTNEESEGDRKEKDRPPSTLTHHALQCYIISLACMHRCLKVSIKQSIAEYMFQAVEHWYMTMNIKALKQYPRSQIHAILRKLYYLISNCNNAMREEQVKKFEYLRLEIAYRWLSTDSLERKITAWKEFKEYIETTQRKYDIINNPHKYANQQLSQHSYCKNPKAVAIYYINYRDVAQFLHRKNVLMLFLAEDVHEELLKKSFDIMYFLGWYSLLDKKYINMLWSHSIEKTESFVNTVYKVIIDLFQCLKWELIEHLLDLIIAIPVNTYNNAIINLIASFCDKCLYRCQLSTNTTTNTITVPQKIAEWHCGLILLWRAMQSERPHSQYTNPLAKADIQQLAMTKLVHCLQSDSGAVHQEYCKNLCVENLRCSRSVGTSLRVLQNIINAHPIMPPPPPPNTGTTQANTSFDGKLKKKETDDTKVKESVCEQSTEDMLEEDTKDNDEETPKHSPTGSGSYFGRESTRSEIIHSLEKHHGILNLFFQDLSRYMSAYNPQSIDHPMNQQEHKTEGDSSTSQPRQIVNFRARFDFVKFILQYSSLRLSNKQLDDLWNIVIGDTLKSDYSIPYSYKLEQKYFFKWLKDICPPINANNSAAITVDDAVNLFHTKLGSMPRKTMTSDSLQCLHQYFDLEYELATKKSATSGVTAHPDLSAALDVMWEIAIEAETDTVAQSCGVFILSFYMKPAVHQNHIQQQTQTQSQNIQNQVSDNILKILNDANKGNSGNTANVTMNTDTQTVTVNVNKWEGRTNFVEKCMEYIQQQSISNGFRAVQRCLDLLETFIECTRPGVMKGEIQSASAANDLNGFGDESSSDSVIYMGNNSGNSGVGTTGLTPKDFTKTSPWDLGRYAIKYWKLPIGLNHFIKINVSNLQMQKDTKNFQIMINKYARVGELQDLIAALLNQDKGLLQMQANNVQLTPQIESNTLDACQIRDNCTVTVMSIFTVQNDPNSNLLVPDGAFILSQNRFYIEVLLELLNKRGNNGNLSSRLWNLLMRLPFNLQVLGSLKDIVGYVQSDDNNNKIITNNVNWNLFIDASSTFKLLYSLQVFDSVMQHCNSSWLDSFMILNGLQHVYYTLINFQFDYTDNVCTYASYRALYMLFKIFSSLTSHELIESDPLYTRCKPRHNTPKIIKIRSVNGTLSKFNHNELDVLKLGSKIFELILEILQQIEQTKIDNDVSTGNPLLAEIVELALYQFIALLFCYSSRLAPLFDDRYQQQSLPNDSTQTINWINLVSSSLFCKDKLIRQCVVKHLFQIFVKYNPDADASQNLHQRTLELLYHELESCKLNYARHFMCVEYFEFYGYVIKHYCKNVIYFQPSSYSSCIRYFEGGPLQYAWNALKIYRGLETTHSDKSDEYLLGLLKLLCSILIGFPTLKQHSMKLIRDLKNELIQCLFAVPDPFEDPLTMLTAPKRPPIPKCMTSASRRAAFDLLLEISKNNPLLWNEILVDLQDIHDKRMTDIGDDIGFGFNPEYSRRSAVGLCGLNNYGCTCYMNATMQQLYCNPVVRKVILGVDLRKLYPMHSDSEHITSLKKTVFYAMQTMFSNLQWTDKRAVWPEDFLQNYHDFEGNKIDPNEQMDAHEFFNFLFDNLERELKGTIAEQILKDEFCGKEVNQVICQECGYVSETFVPMYAVSCKIQNHQTLEESLEDEFVKGDWLKGGNAYRCSKCNKKVTALKRSCFTQLSNTMLVHLQRFEFNLETMLKVKINSELRFPINLNMKKYTKEYLDFKENKCSSEELMSDSDYEYELVGITVHSGMADIGHYYSFIRQQNDNGTLSAWYNFNDDYVSKFETHTMSDKCFGGNKLTLIRDSKTNQLVQRWIAKSNNAYILVYRRKNINKKVENMAIEDEYLTVKEYKLNELKANNGKPPKLNIVEQNTVAANAEEMEETVTEKQTEHEQQTVQKKSSLSPQESATEASNSPQIMETSKGGETPKESKPIIAEPDDEDTNAETEHVRDPDLADTRDRNVEISEVMTEENDTEPINEDIIGHSLELEDEQLNYLFEDEDGDNDEMKTVASQHHLYDIAETVHWNNTRFTKKCQLCDMNLCDFEWRFFHLQYNTFSNSLPHNRYKSDKVRENIGSLRTKLILYFVWDVLCKFDTATKIPTDDSTNNNSMNKKERRRQLKKLTQIYEWCEFVKKLFQNDIESSYQFLYILTRTKQKWLRYLLESKNALVRECLVDLIIFAVKRLIEIERPLYYLREGDTECAHTQNEENIDSEDLDEDMKSRDEKQEMIEINRNKKDERVQWFSSASVIVTLLDEMCRNILIATNYWRRFNEFWLFFKLFAEIGNEEKQLLLDRHLIVECYRFYSNKKPYEYGLKQLIKDSVDLSEEDLISDRLLPHKVKYDRRKMGSNDSEPDVSNMVHMLALIICSSCPPNLKGAVRINKLSDIILPYATMELSVCSTRNKFNLLPIIDKKLLADPKIWMKFLEDNQNTNCLSNIMCHLSWRNIDFSKKVCKQCVLYLEEYHDNVYHSCFTVAKALLAIEDYIEEHKSNSNSSNDESLQIKIFAHHRIDRFLTPTIKMIRDWYRDNKYMQSVAKVAQFIDELAQNNVSVANYFRIKSKEINVQWFQQFLNSHSYYLNLPRPPEFN